MVVRSSSAKEVDALIAQLEEGSPVRREAAIARLRVIGARAVDRLIAVARGTGSDAARAAAIKALEGIPEARARDAALTLLEDSSPLVASAAVGAVRPWLSSDTQVLDVLTALAFDKTRPAAARLAALDALADLPRAVIQPVLQQIGDENSSLLGAVTGERPAGLDDPAGVRDWVAKRGATAPLSDLHAMLTRIRERNGAEQSPHARQEWQVAGAAVHLVLARRGSRIALYDLRETFDAAPTSLPLDLLHAAGIIGDASCLEPMARAWAAAGRDLWWRDRLAETARAIVARERLTARSAVIKRIRERHPGFLN
jgi:hypothetical protein